MTYTITNENMPFVTNVCQLDNLLTIESTSPVYNLVSPFVTKLRFRYFIYSPIQKIIKDKRKTLQNKLIF